MHWLNMKWWFYLLSDLRGRNHKIATILCRAGDHKGGVFYYNPSGIEPNMECKRCGDVIG